MALSDRGVRELVQSPLADNLTHLDLSDNPSISAEGIRALIDSPLWPRLQELNLGKLYSRDAEIVRLVLQALPRSRITRLGLRGALFHEARRQIRPRRWLPPHPGVPWRHWIFAGMISTAKGFAFWLLARN